MSICERVRSCAGRSARALVHAPQLQNTAGKPSAAGTWQFILSSTGSSNGMVASDTIRVKVVDPLGIESITAEDTGIGIAPEDLPRLGERGYTGYNGREDKKSTGLGLYLCRRVCDKLGHRLVIESTPGVGTRAMVVFADRKNLYE